MLHQSCEPAASRANVSSNLEAHVPQITLRCVRLTAYLWNPTVCETLPCQTPNPIIQQDGLTAPPSSLPSRHPDSSAAAIHPQLRLTQCVHSSSSSSSSSLGKDTVKWLVCCLCLRMAVCVCVCVRAHCISVSVIRYNVFIKRSSVPALSSECFFVPARPVSWLAHIIAP